MQVFFYLINIVIILYAHRRFRDYLNPIFILFVVWTGFSGAYELFSRFQSGYRILSETYYLYVSLFLYTFCIVSFFILRNVRKKSTINNGYFVNNLNISIDSVNLILIIAICANLFYILVLLVAGGSFNPIEAMSNIRALTRGDDPSSLASIIKIPALLFNFTPLILAYIFMYKVKANNKIVFILMIEMFFISFLLSTKGRIIRFTLLLLIMLKQKLSKRKFIFVSLVIIPVALFIMYTLVINRDRAYFDLFTMNDYLFVYFLSPIPGLDRLVCGELSYVTLGFGPRTLEYFYSLISGLIGSGVSNYVDPGYVRISTANGFVTSNVFTGLGLYYLDYKMIGAVVCAFFFSFVYTFVYKKMVRGKKGYAIFYVINFPYLLFHAFGDLIIGSISITIQEFLSAIFLIYFVKKVRIRFG